MRGFSVPDLLMMSKFHRENLSVSNEKVPFRDAQTSCYGYQTDTDQTLPEWGTDSNVLRPEIITKISIGTDGGVVTGVLGGDTDVTIYDVKTTSGNNNHESVKNDMQKYSTRSQC